MHQEATQDCGTGTTPHVARNPTKQFAWCGSQRKEERDGVTSSTVVTQFFPLGQKNSSTSYFYTRDHLGSEREMTMAAAGTTTVEAQYGYDPYGRVTQHYGASESDGLHKVEKSRCIHMVRVPVQIKHQQAHQERATNRLEQSHTWVHNQFSAVSKRDLLIQINRPSSSIF